MIKVHNAKVIENLRVTKDVHIVRIKKPSDFKFKAGQYVSISVNINGKKVRRPYSISSSPKPNYIEICVKRIENGPASNYVCNLSKDDEIEFLGPVGKFTIEDKNVNEKDNILFISTGTGIGPFVSMIKDLIEKKHKGKIKLISGFKSEKEILYKNEFESIDRLNVLSKNKNYVQDFLKEDVKEFDKIYICGLKEMINEVKEKLSELKFPEENVFFEEWD